MSDPLDARRVLVTGGSGGIGRAVCLALAKRGARVVVAGRRRDAIAETLAALGGGGHRGLELDVGDAEAWPRALAELDADGALHGLVTAAAELEPIGPLGSYEPSAFWRTVRVNLYGTLLALHHCLPRLSRASGAAVTFSGGGATGPLPRYDAYAASKAAVVRLSENVAAVAEQMGVPVNCVAPGFVPTGMHEATLAAGPERAGEDYYDLTRRTLEEGGASPERAAELVCFLLGPEARRIRGKLISAQWDPWEEPEFRRRLETEPDLATLRRIDGSAFVPAPARA
jgi:3-oxoacyl-[acyl-carrier protein] reductase